MCVVLSHQVWDDLLEQPRGKEPTSFFGGGTALETAWGWRRGCWQLRIVFVSLCFLDVTWQNGPGSGCSYSVTIWSLWDAQSIIRKSITGGSVPTSDLEQAGDAVGFFLHLRRDQFPFFSASLSLDPSCPHCTLHPQVRATEGKPFMHSVSTQHPDTSLLCPSCPLPKHTSDCSFGHAWCFSVTPLL